MDRLEAQKLLLPHFARFSNVLSAGFETLEAVPARERARLGKGTKASIVHDGMVFEATRAFRDVPGTRMLDIRGLAILAIGPNLELMMRFKKLDDRGVPCCYPTAQATLIDLNQFEIFPNRPVQFVTLGYRLTNTGIPDGFGYVSCTHGDTVLWSIPVPKAPPAEGQVFPMSPPAPPAPRIVPKPAAAIDKKEERGNS